MAEVTVRQFADVLKVPVERLLGQLRAAGITVGGAEDIISDDAKMELLQYLRRKMAAPSQPVKHSRILSREHRSDPMRQKPSSCNGTLSLYWAPRSATTGSGSLISLKSGPSRATRPRSTRLDPS